MTDKDKAPKAETKPKVAKKPAAPKAEAKAAAPAKAAPAKTAKPAAAKSGATLTIQQVGSPIGRQGYQRATLIGLGLNKMMRTRTLEDTASIRGMIESVKHLVKIVN